MNVDLDVVREDLAYERRALDHAARAPHDGRLADPVALLAAQARRRDRIEELEALEHALVSLEEASAQVHEMCEPEYVL